MMETSTPFPGTYRRCQLLLLLRPKPNKSLPHRTIPPRRPPRIAVVAVATADSHSVDQGRTSTSHSPPPRPPNRETGQAASHTTQTRPKTAVGRDGNQPHSRVPPPSSVIVTLCNLWEDMVNKWLEPLPLRPSIDPEHVLAGNFAPVPELPPTPCPVVKGSIPSALRGGAYVRNGPNPQHPPRGPHHLFDGDGMLHSLLLPAEGGRSPALLCSRFVRTHKYTVEKEAGAPVFPNFFTFHGLAGVGRSAVGFARVVSGQMNPGEGISLANTSVAFFHGRLLALGEPDLPYVVRLSPDDGELSTVGRCNSNLDGGLFEGMTAHPKKDPDTGEVFAFRCRPFSPFLTYFRFDEDGKKQPDVPISSVRTPSLLHDFAITKRYAVFPDIQMVMDPLGMALGGEAMIRSDRTKVSRIGVIPRRATSGEEMRWFDVPGFNPLHTLNAWDEGPHTVVLVAPNVFNVEHLLDRIELLQFCVEMVRIDLRNNIVTRIPLSVRNLDMGVINPAYVGKKNRYSYLGIAGAPGKLPKTRGVAKLDLELAMEDKDCLVGCREYAPGCFGGEPFFVAREGAEEEDDGYLVTYLHNENSGESWFVVMDAKSPRLDVVAEVLLPRRVPYGFHGVFLKQSELRNQRVFNGVVGVDR